MDTISPSDLDRLITAIEVLSQSLKLLMSVRRQQVTLSGIQQAGDVFFPVVLPSTNYFVTASVVGFTGAPPLGASVIIWTKFIDHIHGQLAAAPGVGNSVTYDLCILQLGP
jgi:hypothetical protein